ncbi:transposase [Ferrimonas pelagia]|uniref:Transposase n=1 Tax=Ferrimonas pelagia TaxID=1177826 RepID=A0ABP9ERK2_9GAMM
MATARRSQVSLQDTPYYHCVTRCVRRSFLCGDDPFTGKSYEHRRGWVEKRLLALSSVFAIELCAFAVMSNHTHVVLRVDRELALSWTVEQVLKRWHSLHKGTLLTQAYMATERRKELSDGQIDIVLKTAEQYRQRLFDLSWFMRSLNEFIAREANREDGCTGRFWEGRFKSQALLDEAAVLSCMAYVDLNPIRAKMAKTPEQSNHTSIQRRIRAAISGKQPPELAPFTAPDNSDMSQGLAYAVDDYLELIEQTGRIIRDDKPGHIHDSLPRMLQRLQITPANWLKLTTEFEQKFTRAAGREAALRDFAEHINHQRAHGIAAARDLLNSA